MKNLTAYVATANSKANAESIADRMTRDGNGLQWVAFARDHGCYVIGTAHELRRLERKGVALEVW